MNIVCACDEKFLPFTTTMLCSLFEHNSPGVQVFFLHSGIPHMKLRTLKHFVEKYKNTFIPIKIDNLLIQGLKIDKHASIANYYRLLIPDVLPESIEKVLYLDSDLIIRKSLEELWNTNIENFFLAAVNNVGFKDHERLNMPPGSKYFNSGVLLINLLKWRQAKIHLKVIDFIRSNPDRIQFWDQDGLNAILAGNWKILPTTWNVQHNYFFPEGSEIRYAKITANPAIVHFSGDGIKPWLPHIVHMYKQEYLDYEKKIPFALRRSSQLTDLKLFIKTTIISLGQNFAHFTVIRHLFSKIFNILNIIIFEQKEVSISNAESIESKIKKLVPDLSVSQGPFKKLKYREAKSIGSTIAPKLLGTYEAELHDTIEKICSQNYSTIINIGCAEGYYAVGLALRNPKAKVFAFDIDPEARKLCRDMADLNEVSDRVIVGEYFEMTTLLDIGCSGSGIIISDCEGAEEYIFYKNEETWDLLISKYDLLVEIHEFIRHGISDYILALFSESYNIEKIQSVDDILRPHNFYHPLLHNLDLETKIELMAEKRPCMMEWFCMSRK